MVSCDPFTPMIPASNSSPAFSYDPVVQVGNVFQSYQETAGGPILFTSVNGNAENTIRQLDYSTGKVSTYSGSANATTTNGPIASAEFASPWGIAGDGAGNLYITQSQDSAIRLISGGNVSTLGTSTGVNNQYATIAFGRLYFARLSNNVIGMNTTTGVIEVDVNVGALLNSVDTRSSDGAVMAGRFNNLQIRQSTDGVNFVNLGNISGAATAGGGLEVDGNHTFYGHNGQINRTANNATGPVTRVIESLTGVVNNSVIGLDSSADGTKLFFGMSGYLYELDKTALGLTLSGFDVDGATIQAKPIEATGNVYIAQDTGYSYISDGTSWIESPQILRLLAGNGNLGWVDSP